MLTGRTYSASDGASLGSALAGRTPDETYAIDREQEKLAA
jgi:hypothetical protein